MINKLAQTAASGGGGIKNILLLSVEDLNDWIEPLGGHPDAVTPNLSRLAARGTVFEQAYTPVPECSPARTAALFGQAPWRTGIYGNRHSWAMKFPPHQRRSIVGQAREAGFRTFGAGKVFHLGKSGLDQADWDDVTYTRPWNFPPVSKAARRELIGKREDFGVMPEGSKGMLDDAMCDQMLAWMQPGDAGKFWAHGVYCPHLPFVAPERFFDMIPDTVRMPPAFGNRGFDALDETELESLPKAAASMPRRWLGRKIGRTGEYKAFLRAYLACVAYADSIVGRILDHLDETGLSDSTLILFWSDHGWQLGEKLAFKKFTLWERALRVPLMMAGPGVPVGRCDAPVSLLDMYPTLLSTMKHEAPHALDGQDLWDVLQGTAAHTHSVSVYEAEGKQASVAGQLSASVRSASHRLIHYHDGTGELYDHRVDPFEKNTLLDPARMIADQELPDDLMEILLDLMEQLPEMAAPLDPAVLPPDLDTLYRPNN